MRSRVHNGSWFVALVLAASSISAGAQTITWKSGQTAETKGLRREGEMVMGKIDVGGHAGEIGYPLAQIAKIDFPEPRGIKEAEQLLSQGDAAKALSEIEPVVAYYSAFRDIPGSWWAAAAIVKVTALSALQRDREAEPLAREIQKVAPDAETARAANLQIAAALVRKQDYEKAQQICDATIKESTRPDVLAQAWVTKGTALFALKEWDSALLAFLRVPVFYPDEKLLMPPALLGSGRAHIGGWKTWIAPSDRLLI